MEDRFWQIVDPTGFCWLWTGSKNQNGYGRFQPHPGTNRKTSSAHRVAWELLIGPISPGYEVDHLCRIKLCVNPDHLEPVTKAENIRRKSWTYRKKVGLS